MVVAMWREGNESSTRCIGIHGGGHVMEMDSPYLLVFGDDRVRGTREQGRMQGELVRLSCGEGSSPYLLVFGDDRVRGTREQGRMQGELVRLSCGEGR
ncbi:hypothetical protein DEO72_LG2g3986 [Vigna unguiculata]|uniref:Uncharacterized protein n=1 Tax=Vigna unguiculata TaxID=3917 RepID=A0A4D6L588_VIGUN|nr:hypothetical protein DEO72_LG2g3986 [Vigna unguiculata]